MKKNALVRMSSPTESVGSRFRKLNILPKLLCLLLAVILWLAVVNVTNQNAPERDPGTAETQQAE